MVSVRVARQVLQQRRLHVSTLRYKIFVGVGSITSVMGGSMQSSNDAVRTILTTFKLFNVCADGPYWSCLGRYCYACVLCAVRC